MSPSLRAAPSDAISSSRNLLEQRERTNEFLSKRFVLHYCATSTATRTVATARESCRVETNFSQTQMPEDEENERSTLTITITITIMNHEVPMQCLSNIRSPSRSRDSKSDILFKENIFMARTFNIRRTKSREEYEEYTCTKIKTIRLHADRRGTRTSCRARVGSRSVRRRMGRASPLRAARRRRARRRARRATRSSCSAARRRPKPPPPQRMCRRRLRRRRMRWQSRAARAETA